MSKFFKGSSDKYARRLRLSFLPWVLTSILRLASPESDPTQVKRAVGDDVVLPKMRYCPNPSQLWNCGEVMEIVPKPPADHRRDAVFESERESGEKEVTSAKMSYDGESPEAETPMLEQAAKHTLTVPEIRVPDDDPDDSYNFQVIPPTPNKPDTSMLDKQDVPEEHPSLYVGDDEVFKYHGASHLNRVKGQAKLRVVETGTGREIRCDPPPYSSLEYGQS